MLGRRKAPLRTRLGGALPPGRSILCALALAAFAHPAVAQELRGTLAETPPTSSDDLGFPAFESAPDTSFAEPPLEDAMPPSPAEIVEPRRKRRIEEDDPYAPLGVRAGSFILKPSFETSGGYESNPRAEAGGKGSTFTRAEADLDVASDWARHQFTAKIRGAYIAYQDIHDLDTPDFAGDMALRLDARSDLKIDLAIRGTIGSDRPGDPEVPESVVGRTEVYTSGISVGATYKPNRLSIGSTLSADRYFYADSKLNNGDTLDNSPRNYTAYELRERIGYELSPALEPFVEVAGNRHLYEADDDFLQEKRDSTGVEALLGARFEPSALIAIEGKAGYGRRDPDSSKLETIDGLIAEGSLIWRPSVLTTMTLTGASSIDETTLPGASGAVNRSTSIKVEHALRRNLILTGQLAYDRVDYEGADFVEDQYSADLGVEYRFTRSVALRARVAHLKLESSVPGEDYTSDLIEMGLRFRR
ncbi:outer membrane beta-barrel protein [Flaviflagellibacter deserti]|uniref:Outer membrane beta-barrel protein n=1 Tax=Flaviflagellibacter deserti TaxID=2267266 RepID=A0ABV9YVV3_9HYPH